MNTISSLETTDLPAAYHIEQRAHAFPWSEKTFASNQGERYLNFQLTQNGKMAAFAITQVVLEDATHQAGPEFAQKAALFNIETFFGWVSDVETFCDALSSTSFARIA